MHTTDTAPDLLPAGAAARALNVTRQRLAALCRDGEIHAAIDLGNLRLFDAREVARVAADRRERAARGERVKAPAI
jgi:hypothetical protein